MANALEKQRKENLFWLMVLGVLVHGSWLHFFGPGGEAEISWKGVMEEGCLPHGS